MAATAVLHIGAALAAVFLLFFVGSVHGGGTVVGFYSASCPTAETIILQTVRARFNKDKTITPALLRMFFHDCIVTGCDASILLDSTPGHPAEKDAGPNLSLRGFDLIDEVKAALEAACPGIVSCADIIALSVRDAVVLAGGPNYGVPCGRRDSLTSVESDADNLPSPSFSIDQVRVQFEAMGLSLTQLVALLGAHTVGVATCSFFNERIFSFQGSGMPDPSLNKTLANKLANVCPNPFTTETSADPAVALDQGTPEVFDTSYFVKLQEAEGILQIDAELMGDARTLPLVKQFSEQEAFFSAFVEAIVAMGNADVKTGAQGQVRKQCSRVNSASVPPSPSPKTTSPNPKPAPPPAKTASPPPKQAATPSELSSLPPNRAPPPPSKTALPPAKTTPKPAKKKRPHKKRHHHHAHKRSTKAQ